MRKTHYIPVTADVPGAASDANCALIRRTIRTDVPETNAMQSMSSINVIKDDETVASEHKREWIEMFQEALVDAAE